MDIAGLSAGVSGEQAGDESFTPRARREAPGLCLEAIGQGAAWPNARPPSIFTVSHSGRGSVGTIAQEGRPRILAMIRGASLAVGTGLALGELGVVGSLGVKIPASLPLVGGAGAVIGLVRFEWLLWVLLAPATRGFILLGLTNAMRGPVHRLVRRDSLPDRADSIVVLAGAMNGDGRIGETALARLAGGIGPLRSGGSSELVLPPPAPGGPGGTDS